MQAVGNIRNEEPEEHWNFLNVKGKVILDLGCAKFWSSIATAEWFVKKEALLVIGVDTHDIGYRHDNFIMETQTISTPEQLSSLISVYTPNIIKCDIEGAEKYFEYLILPENIQQFAVEYHDEKTKAIMEKVIPLWKFSNVEYYTLLGHPLDRIGVIHTWR